MAIGRVKWFNNQKGYGFIETDESLQDVFVHFTDILKKGYKTLREKELVHFMLDDSGKGPNARQVCALSPDTLHDLSADMVPPELIENHYDYGGVSASR